LDAFSKRAIQSIDKFGITYKISEFKKVHNPKAYLYEIFKGYGFTEWNDIVNLLEAQSGKLVRSNSHRLIKHRDFLILTDLGNSAQSKEALFINELANDIETPIGELSFENVEGFFDVSKSTIFVDKDVLKFPLEFRLWKEGDIFQPIGMTGKKKISKYLKDEKVSLVEKENTWILASDNKVVWLVGKRADDRFKVTKNTKNIIKVTI